MSAGPFASRHDESETARFGNLQGSVRSPARWLGVTEGDLT